MNDSFWKKKDSSQFIIRTILVKNKISILNLYLYLLWFG